MTIFLLRKLENLDLVGFTVWSVTLVLVEQQKRTVPHFKSIFKQLILMQDYSQAENVVARARGISPDNFGSPSIFNFVAFNSYTALILKHLFFCLTKHC